MLVLRLAVGMSEESAALGAASFGVDEETAVLASAHIPQSFCFAVGRRC